MSVIQLKREPEWDAHQALEHVKKHTESDAPFFCAFIDKDKNLSWSNNGVTNAELLWMIEQVKYSLITGEY